MRLQAEGPPDPLHRAVGGQALQRPADHRLDLCVADLARCARARLFVQAVEPMLGEAVALRPTPS